MKDDGRFLTVLDINADPDGLRNLDKYILMTLFECKLQHHTKSPSSPSKLNVVNVD